MLHPYTRAVGLLTLTMLGACNKIPSVPTPTVIEAAPPLSSAGPGVGAGTSVPPADSVLTPAPAASTDASAGRTNTTLSRMQESVAMPLPGQNNDHSAALGTARPASAPPGANHAPAMVEQPAAR